GAGQRRAATARARRARAGGRAQRRDRRQPECEDHGKGGERGFDAGKLIRGRKRHILVDTAGLLLRVVCLPADIQDWDGAEDLFRVSRPICPRLEPVWADGAYGRNALPQWAEDACGWKLRIVSRPPDARGFV